MNSVKKFQRVVEDFDCLNCKTTVVGSGYTNHCPNCLASKHVDIFPGDRLEECHGIMLVSDIHQAKKKTIITHTCQKCGENSKDHVREGIDNFDALLEINKRN